MTERIELPAIESIGIIARRLVRDMLMPVRALTRDCAPLSLKRSGADRCAAPGMHSLERHAMPCPHPCVPLYTYQACFLRLIRKLEAGGGS